MSSLDRVRTLRREAPKSRFLRFSLTSLATLGLGSVVALAGGFASLATERRFDNLGRFLSVDVRPYALRDEPFSLVRWWGWAIERWEGGAGEATTATLAIAVVAILAAACLGAGLSLAGSRELARRDPFVADGPADSRGPRSLFAHVVRTVSVLLRAVPEYVLAFLFLALFGANAWPAVLALALHNAGILGRLGAETIEDLPPAPLRALTAAGARKGSLALHGIAPAALGRFLLYFFYRFETCVREATVLGMLGIASLGALVQDARARQHYDEMVFYVLLAGLLVLLADVASGVARRWIRSAL